MYSSTTSTPRKRLIAPANVTLNSMGLARAISMNLWKYRYVEGQARREIAEHRDSPGRSSRAGDIQLRFLRQRQAYQFRPRALGLCKIDGQWKILSVTWTSYDRS